MADPPKPVIALSVVMPCFKKHRELSIVLGYNARYLGRSDVEIVLVLDEPSQEAEVLALLDEFPLLQPRVIVNDHPHDWRPPCVAINVGIRSALGDFVLVVSPESIFAGDAPSRVVDVLRDRPSDVLLGRVTFATFAEAHGRQPEALFGEALAIRGNFTYATDYYGSIAASRDLFHSVRGFDESLRQWGGDDDNIRSRLSMRGAMLMLDRNLSLVHLSETLDSERRVHERTADQLREVINPASAEANERSWGVEFDRIARDWNEASADLPADNRDPPQDAARSPLHVMEQRISTGWTQRRAPGAPNVLAVFSFRYDAHLIDDLIENIGPMVDGWIAYDDRGSDALFSNEVERRRVLLRVAHELGARWLLAVDPDERFEVGLADRIEAMTRAPGPPAWAFRLRELYTPDQYRIDGVWAQKMQTRLFPLRGDLRLATQALHAPWCGYGAVDSQLNLYHLKMISPERRRGRSALYNFLDPDLQFQSGGYDYLADDRGAVLEAIPQGRRYFPSHHDDGGLWMPEPPTQTGERG